MTAHAQGLRILVAEDDPLMRQVLCLLLRARGHRVEAVPDGLRASETASEHIDGFDLVITDHEMPWRNGLEFVRHLREAAFAGKIIVLSSPPSDAAREAYRRLEVNEMVSKPVGGEVLFQLIDKLLPQASSSRAA